MVIKKLPKSIKVNLEQYECVDCKKKFYINSEDKIEHLLPCPFCEGETKNIRIFNVEIKGIGEYEN